MEQPAGAVFIDLFFLLLCVRILYISVSRGILGEVIKIIGLLSGAFFAFQYYSFVGNTVGQSILFLNKKYFQAITFLVILLGIRTIFSFLGLIVRLLFKREEIAILERWISFFAGSFRAIMLASIILFVFYLSPFDSRFVSHSLTYSFFKDIAPGSYLISQNIITSLNPKFKINKDVKDYVNSPRDYKNSKKGGLLK